MHPGARPVRGPAFREGGFDLLATSQTGGLFGGRLLGKSMLYTGQLLRLTFGEGIKLFQGIMDRTICPVEAAVISLGRWFIGWEAERSLEGRCTRVEKEEEKHGHEGYEYEEPATRERSERVNHCGERWRGNDARQGMRRHESVTRSLY